MYIISKDYVKQGSIAWSVPADLNVASFVNELENEYENTTIQFVTTGRLDIYIEYHPVCVVHSVEEFKERIETLAMH